MHPSNKSNKTHAPYQDGKALLCSCCFSTLGQIVKYGHDNDGYWFIAPCKACGTKMKWYRTKDGTSQVETEAKEDATFGLTMIDGELTLTLGES